MTTDMTAKGLVYSTAAMATITVEQHTYPTAQGPLPFELYRPTGPGPFPVVVFVTGYPDPGAKLFFGRPLMEWASYREWGRLVATRGLAGITYLNRDPADVYALLAHLHEHASTLGLDMSRLGVWSCSGNGPNALGVIARERPRCATLLYPMTMDLDGATTMRDASAAWRFALPPVSLDELRAVPMLVVRAVKDAIPGLDPTLVRFLAAARERDLPVTAIEHADGQHAFDLLDDVPRSREVIEEVLAYLYARLE